MARSRKLLYVGTGRYVAALDPKTGEECWRTKLPHAGASVVTMLIKDEHLLVGHAGHAYCLAKASGEIIWENGLPRMGYNPVLLAMEGAQGPSAGDVAGAWADGRRRAAAAGAGA
ncbi:MAG: PQQ-binding-like beta-propeller repeat protein [Phycisphaerae bacterium]|nr:PQQ-binding-like beta-propeller repeat protein [Phycisphaerae bacterium]